jgi:hypothetical protein
MKAKSLNIIFVSVTLLIAGCIKPFIPTGMDSMESLIVIEGDIIQNDTTRITVSRSLGVNEEGGVDYISTSTVWVESEKGTKYNAVSAVRRNKPVFLINTIGIDPALKYKLCLKIQSKLYESELIPVLVSPPIDSIGYTKDTEKMSATFYVNAHDPDNKTTYYRWFFNENWEIQSQFQSLFEYQPATKTVISIPFEKNRYYCWSSGTSSSVLIASTSGLSADVVYQKPLVSMGSSDRRISALYSMELFQMAISEEAYKYWDNIQKNSDQVGGIFSPQPSEIKGNIKCISNPSEKVIGYISAAKTAKKRIFVSGKDIGIYQYPTNCEVVFINKDNPLPIASMWDKGLDVTSYTGDPPFGDSYWVSKRCVDCRIYGTKSKPSFWPNDHI